MEDNLSHTNEKGRVRGSAMTDRPASHVGSAQLRLNATYNSD